MATTVETAILDRSVNFPFAERDTATSDADGFTTAAEDAATLASLALTTETQIQGYTRSGLRKATFTTKPLSSGYNPANSPTN